jgi:hypothetical protein
MCIITIYVVLGGFLRAVFPLLVVTLMFFYSRREWTTFLIFRNEILLGLTAVYVQYPAIKSERSSFSKAQFNLYFLFLTFKTSYYV